MSYGWEAELPALSALPADEAAVAINAMTIPNNTPVIISFRDFQNIQSSGSYSAMKQMFLNYTTGIEAPISGWWVTDMFEYPNILVLLCTKVVSLGTWKKKN